MTVEDEKPPDEIAAPSPPAQPPPEPVLKGDPVDGPIPRDVNASAPQDDPSVLSGGLSKYGDSNNSVKSTFKGWKGSFWSKKKSK
jgi:hypothetical protein